MNVKEYIASGILEDYTLNLLSDQERREVECMSHIYPEIREELEQLQMGLEGMADALSMAPPPELKAKVLSAIDDVEQEKTSETKVISMSPSQEQDKAKGGVNWLAAASIILLVAASSFLYFNSNQRIADLEAALEQNKEQINELSAENNDVKQLLGETESHLAFLKKPDTKTIELAGTEAYPESLAQIYWNENTKETFLEVVNLDTPPADKQYQLWAIVDGAPTDMGVFDIKLDTNALQKMAKVDAPQAFAITLEDKGGSPVPTLTTMRVIGNI